MNLIALKAQLVRHEGDRRLPYRDQQGNLTIGVGRDLDSKPLSDAVVRQMLEEDIAEATERCLHLVPSFAGLDELRQRVLVNMSFNLGNRLHGFTQFLAAVDRRDFAAAAVEMLDSAWAKEVGARATELAQQMEKGV